MERIKSALEKAKLERERLQRKTTARQIDIQVANMETPKISEADASRMQILGRAPFVHCTPAQQQALIRDGTFMQVNHGETFQFAGEIDGYIHYLISGIVVIESDNSEPAEVSANAQSDVIPLDKAGLKTRTLTARSDAEIFRIAQSSLPDFAQYRDDEPLPQSLYTDTQSGKDLADLVERLGDEHQSIEQSAADNKPQVPVGENTLGFNFDFNELGDRSLSLEGVEDAVADLVAPRASAADFGEAYEPDIDDEIGQFTRTLDRQFRDYVNQVRADERARYEQMMERHAEKLKRAAEGKLREKVNVIRDRYDIAYARKEEKLLERLSRLREFADQITRQKAAIYEARRGLSDKLAQAEKLRNELANLGDEVNTQLDKLDDLMPSTQDMQDAVGEN